MKAFNPNVLIFIVLLRRIAKDPPDLRTHVKSRAASIKRGYITDCIRKVLNKQPEFGFRFFQVFLGSLLFSDIKYGSNALFCAHDHTGCYENIPYIPVSADQARFVIQLDTVGFCSHKTVKFSQHSLFFLDN